MKNKLINVFLLVLAVIFEMSVLPALFLPEIIPNLVLVFILVWVIIFGFRPILGWLIMTGVLYDIAAHGKVGISVIIFVFIAYLANSISRRFLIENKGLGIASTIILVFGATIIWKMANPFFINSPGIILNFFSWKGAENFILVFFYNLCLFYLCFIILRKVNRQAFERLKLTLIGIVKS